MKRFRFCCACALIALAGACGHTDSHDSHGNHEHNEHILITAYTPDFEVFAEADPLVAGEEGDFLVHVTRLSDFKPLEQGKVTLTLASGEKSVEAAAQEPVKPGIFKLHLTPAATGKATLKITVSADGMTSSLNTGDLEVYPNEHEAHEAAGEAEIKSGNAVVFTKEMGWKSDFNTVEAMKRETPEVIRAMGRVEPSRGDIRTVAAKSSGILTIPDASLSAGANVRAGEVLFRIDGSSMAADNLRARVLTAQSDYKRAKADLERLEALRADKLCTETEYSAARNAYESAKAQYDALRQGFSGGAETVVSPISGFLTQLDVANGQYVEAGQQLATVAQNRDLLVTAEVPQSKYTLLPGISGANLKLKNGEILSLTDLSGSVVSYGKSVDSGNPLIPVTFRVANHPGLIPGGFVEIFILSGSGNEAVSVPSGAVLEEMGNNFVYVQLTPEYFEKREVSVGRSDGVNTEILSGLKAGERVVGRGAVLVKLAHASGALDAHSGHVH